jgi:2-keto-4-pentenoate hydratase
VDQGFDNAVRRIVEARRALTFLEDLPAESQPPTLADAYRMQRAVIERWDDEIAGWKVGATSKYAQDLFGISAPVYGPVFRKTVVAGPAILPAKGFHHLMLETEFAFRFGQDLPARPTPYTRNEIVAAIDALVPAFEIVSPRFSRLAVDKLPQVVADYCANGGAVLGSVCERWHEVDLPSHQVKLSIGGTLRQEGSGAAVLGDPLNVVEWFVDTFRAQGLSVARGEFVMTGTMTGIHIPEIGQRAVADFGNLGRVEVEFA